MKIRISLALQILCLFCLIPSAHARPSGDIKTTVDSYPAHLKGPTEDLVPYLSIELGDKYRLSRKFRAQWKVLAMSGFTADGPPENFYGDIPEGFLEYRPKNDLKFRVGMNTVNWGIVDVNSPSDVVNNVALFHPLRIHKQAAPMTEVQWGAEVLNLDLIYVPFYRNPPLPSTNSRWLPRSLLLDMQEGGTRVTIPQKLEYKWDHPQTLGNAVGNFGGKLASHQGAWDFQASYFRGISPFPKVVPTTLDLDFGNTADEVVVRSPVHLTAYSYIVETTGGGFVWAGENLIVRGESAYQNTISKSPLLQPWSWSNVLALETNVNVDERTLTLLLEGFYTSNPQSADNLISSSYRLFDRTALIGGRFNYADDLVLIASALYETKTRGVFWMAGFEQKLRDHLSWSLGWRDFSAQRDGLLKTYDRNDHATLEMTYLF